MKRHLLLCISLFTLLFVSCSRQEFDNRTEKELLAQSNQVSPNYLPGACPYDCHDTRCKAYLNGYCGVLTPDTLKVVSNSNNPEESVGVTHNNTMYSVMPHYNNGTLQPTDANVFAYTKAYLISQHEDSTIINGTNNYIMTTYGSYMNIPDINTQATTLYNNHTITLQAKNYLNTLSTKTNTFGSSIDSAAPTQASYNSLITYENQINNSTTLTANDKYILDCAYVIARYSCIYHINYMIKNNTWSSGSGSASANTVSPLLQSRGSWFSGKEAFNWDIAGGVGGAVGALIGGFFTSGLTWGAVGIAATEGAGVASASDAAYQIASHYN